MHLIAPLISGIVNAGDGTAAVFRRGTATPATLYSSFEGDAFASSDLDSNDRVILDAYGRKEVYVNEVCDVLVYDSEGQLQISFTAGYSAAGIEVRSQSFTGNDYDSGAQAAGEPTTLQAVLDLWKTERTDGDWGIEGSSNSFFVVTDPAYGAKGDATTDDYAAIQGAIDAADAANGGIVYFPAGTYRVTTALLLPTGSSTVKLLGPGSGAAQLRIDHGTEHLMTLGSYSDVEVEGLFLTAAQSNTGYLVSMEPSGTDPCDLVFRSCVFGNSFVVGDHVHALGSSYVELVDCEMSPRATGCAVYHEGSGGVVVMTRVNVEPVVSGAFTASALVYGYDLRLTDCSFDLRQITSGTVRCVRYPAGTNIYGKIVGCYFGPPNTGGTATAIGMDLDTPGAFSSFVESGNRTNESYTPLSTPTLKLYSYSSATTGVHLHTRERRVLKMTENGSSADAPTDQYGIIIISSTNTGLEVDGHRPPVGATGWIFVYHPSGGAGTAELQQNFFADTSVVTANTSTHCWQYVCVAVNSTLRMVATVDARSLGTAI